MKRGYILLSKSVPDKTDAEKMEAVARVCEKTWARLTNEFWNKRFSKVLVQNKRHLREKKNGQQRTMLSVLILFDLTIKVFQFN